MAISVNSRLMPFVEHQHGCWLWFIVEEFLYLYEFSGAQFITYNTCTGPWP